MPFQNELLLIASLIFYYGAVLIAWWRFGKAGLYAMTVFCTLAANIEVAVLVSAFGMDQTLGNVLFAASFLITDILSENVSRKAANRAVSLGIFTSVLFALASQSWLLFIPAGEDSVAVGMQAVFAHTPRIILASVIVYAVVQRMDVWLYHKIWQYTARRSGDSRRYLWLRNNGATLIAQLVNTVLFTLCAFGGIYSAGTLVSIMASGFLIYALTSLCDTPVVYLARRITPCEQD